MQTTWSASWAPRLPRSASETARIDSIPSSKQALTIRTAISPRLAIRTRRSGTGGSLALGVDDDDRLSEFHRRTVLDQDRGDNSINRRGHMVHELHDLNNRDRVSRRDSPAHLHKRRRTWR